MSIKNQADHLIRQTRLLEVLNRHGTPAITGSYFMNIMAWNDLDLYLNPGTGFDPYSMIADLNAALRPFRFDGFVNDRSIFYGCETTISGERWNIDVWIRTEAEIAESLASCAGLLRRMESQPGTREAIVAIKTALIQKGLYGFDKHPVHHYHSRDIYDAVLNEGILSPEEFLSRHPLT